MYRARLGGTGKGAEEARQALLQGPKKPEALSYLWSWWIELNAARSYGMNGPETIGYEAIDAWARLTGRAPDPLEVEGLLTLDRAIQAVHAEKRRA